MTNKIFKTLALSTLLASSFANAGYVGLGDAVTWGLNASGGGTTSGTIIATDEIKFAGYSYTDSNDTLTGFNNYGYLLMGSYFNNNAEVDIFADYGIDAVVQDSVFGISAVYTDWVGAYTSYEPADDDEVNFEFVSGTLDWFADGTTDPILESSIVSGNGDLNLSGSQRGQLTMILEVTDVTAGYFFIDLNNDGSFIPEEDLSYILANSVEPVVYGYAGSDNEIIDNSTPILDDILADEGITGTFDELTAGFGDVFTESDGSFVFREVPEPGMLSLMGLALFGFAGFQRRRKQS